MRDRLADAWVWLFETPDTGLGWLGWIVEGLLGFGLIYRGVTHILGYALLHGEVHPLEVDWGLVPFAVQADATGREPTLADRAEIGFWTAAFWGGLLASINAATLWEGNVFGAVLLGANAALLVSDPLVVAASVGRDRLTNTQASETATAEAD